MTGTATCPECGAHFSASDQESATAIRDEHLKREHGPKVDVKTLAYIEGLEAEIASLLAKILALETPKKRKATGQ